MQIGTPQWHREVPHEPWDFAAWRVEGIVQYPGQVPRNADMWQSLGRATREIQSYQRGESAAAAAAAADCEPRVTLPVTPPVVFQGKKRFSVLHSATSSIYIPVAAKVQVKAPVASGANGYQCTDFGCMVHLKGKAFYESYFDKVIGTSILGSSLFSSFSGTVSYSVIILCFTSSIHLQ
ncbi:hypothetical protein STEG23_006303, partial [Scotinomys teguina]